jgi:hypothetical protein
MNRHVNAISGRLSLRPPQRRSLEILDRITEISPPGKDADVTALLGAIRSEFPSVVDFEREFPSLCFALATGVGKTRLMGAFISYLHRAVEEQQRPVQLDLDGLMKKADITAVVAKTVELVTRQTIDIPRILVVPKGEVKSGFKPFTLKLDTLKYPAISDILWIQLLRTNQLKVVALGRGGIEEEQPEN